MRNPYVFALLHPINLSMLALITAAGLCAAWWLFPFGILIWIIMVLNIARDPSLKITYQIKSRKPLAPRFETKFDQIESWQVKLYNILAAAKPKIRRAFQPVQIEVNKLTTKVHDLCWRNSALENYRQVQNQKEDLEAEWVTLNQEIEKTSDLLIRKSLVQSLGNIETRMKRHQQITMLLEQVDAQMVNVKKILENIVTEILQLQALGLDAIEKDRGRLIEKLHRISKQMDQFEESQLTYDIDISNPPVE